MLTERYVLSESKVSNRNTLITGESDGRIRFLRVSIGGLPVAVLSRQQTARLMISAALSRRGSGRPCLFLTSINGQVVSLIASNAEVSRLYERADLISADGMSVVLASRLRCGISLPERVATTDVFHDAARIALTVGATFYLLGGTEQVNRMAAKRVREIHPGLNIVGQQHGYFAPESESEIVDAINVAAPDILWVGLGVPHAQQFIRRNLSYLTSVGVAKSCGGLFDFLAGRNRRAPLWMQTAGLEWAYRVWEEPKRLSWRYLTTNPSAAYILLRSQGDVSEGAIEVI